MGQTTSYGYDALNRSTSIDYAASATPDVAYTYDGDGVRVTGKAIDAISISDDALTGLDLTLEFVEQPFAWAGSIIGQVGH